MKPHYGAAHYFPLSPDFYVKATGSMAQIKEVATRQASPREQRTNAIPRRKGLLARFSMAHGLMVLSGFLAFVLIAAVLGDRGERIRVAVARGDLAAGTVVRPALLKTTELPADSPLAPTLVTLDRVRSGRWITSRSVAAGEPMRLSDLARGEASLGLRSMSIPVPRENAAGGALAVGDRIDVIDTVEGVASYVVTDVEVTKVSAPSSSGGITRGAGREFFVVVQVDAAQALAIAEALADGKVNIVRSTGAGPAPIVEPPLPSDLSDQEPPRQ